MIARHGTPDLSRVTEWPSTRDDADRALTSPAAREHMHTARRLTREGRPLAAAAALRLANAAEEDHRAATYAVTPWPLRGHHA